MANEKRLIDANALLKKLRKNRKPGYGYATATIGEMPTVDAVEVVHGEWIMCEDENDCEYGNADGISCDSIR